MATRVFITGGASGLGRALAMRYAEAGAWVCIGDVHESRLEEVASALFARGATVRAMHCDVTCEGDLERVRDLLQREWGGVDIVINNAGVASAGRIETTSIDDWRWTLDINLLGVVRGCRAFTPLLKRQGHGHFVNVASMAGLMLLPGMSAYNVSKAGVFALSETLRYELEPHGIGVTVVGPSFFRTNLLESMRTSEPRLRANMQRLLMRSTLTAEDIADQIYEAVRRRRYLVLPHRYPRLMWYAKRLLPALYRRRMQRSARRIEGSMPLPPAGVVPEQ